MSWKRGIEIGTGPMEREPNVQTNVAEAEHLRSRRRNVKLYECKDNEARSQKYEADRWAESPTQRMRWQSRHEW
ncbi:hypothetical protein R1flu_024142 [Riccia fluitans]|uniref:Uncharacterized protein n=1 Tax=Riccia fluitans TaxID=41844 RepID=A0ABD1XU28_9MARC